MFSQNHAEWGGGLVRAEDGNFKKKNVRPDWPSLLCAAFWILLPPIFPLGNTNYKCLIKTTIQLGGGSIIKAETPCTLTLRLSN
jgi:hypothetical protein